MNKIVIYLIGFVFQYAVGSNDCTFKLDYGSPKRPLFFENSSDLRLVLPSQDGAIHLTQGDSIHLSCLDKKFKYFNAKDLLVTCLQEDMVEVKKQPMKFVELECEAYPTSIIRRRHESCSENGQLFDIGYNIRGEFLLIMVTCYVPSEARTVYSYYNHSHLISDHPSTNVQRINFQDDNLYDFDIAETYSQGYQRKEFEILLESHLHAERFLRGDEKHKLISSPLMPSSFFELGYEKAATFHYLNAAPQWAIIRNGIWRKVENKVRARLIDGGKKFSIMSGTYGVATLPDGQNVERDLFLHRNQKGQRFHPVPKFFWKIIYDKEEEKGEAIIVVNNPYLKEISAEYLLCQDICSGMKWLNMKRSTTNKGYVYCCEMEQFLKSTGIENVFNERITSREIHTPAKIVIAQPCVKYSIEEDCEYGPCVYYNKTVSC